MKITKIFGIGLFAILVMFQNCSEVKFTEAQFNPGGSLTTTNLVSCGDYGFQQPSADKVLDIWFLTDTSGSQADERGAIADGIDSFVNQLPGGTNFRIGVTLSHAAGTPEAGNMRNSMLSGEPDVLSFDTAGRNAFLKSKLLGTKPDGSLQNNFEESISDGGEMGLISSRVAIERKLASNKSKGFFRSGVPLSVIYISDENDICSRYNGMYPANFPFVVDGQHAEDAPAAKTQCEGVPGSGSLLNDPTTHVSTLASLQKLNVPLQVTGINYFKSDYPKNGENEIGYGYLDLINLVGSQGLKVEMDYGSNSPSTYYSGKMADIGQQAATLLNLQDQYTLPVDADKNNIVKGPFVFVDGVEQQAGIGYTYDPSTRKIVLNNKGTYGSQIKVSACVSPK